MYKFEKLEVWQDSMKYLDIVYDIIRMLPPEEKFNLASQLRRAATSISLNIAEGSMGQTNKQQIQFLTYSIRSAIETAAIIKIIVQRNYNVDHELISHSEKLCEKLVKQLYSFRRYLRKKQKKNLLNS